MTEYVLVREDGSRRLWFHRIIGNSTFWVKKAQQATAFESETAALEVARDLLQFHDVLVSVDEVERA